MTIKDNKLYIGSHGSGKILDLCKNNYGFQSSTFNAYISVQT